MCSKPFSSMTPANRCEIGRIAHRPVQTKYEETVNAITEKISNDNHVT